MPRRDMLRLLAVGPALALGPIAAAVPAPQLDEEEEARRFRQFCKCVNFIEVYGFGSSRLGGRQS